MTPDDEPAVRAAVRWYRLLLRFLPPAYRRAVSGEWCQVFRDEYADVRRSGRVAVALLGLRVVLDLITILPGAWWSVVRESAGRRRRYSRLRQRRRGARRWGAALRFTDLRYAVRSLRRHPAPVLVSVLSLSLGIGATTTMISVVDAIDFRPLPYRDADRLVTLGQTGPGLDGQLASPGLFLDWQDRLRGVRSLAAASPIAVSVGDDEMVLRASRVSEEFFRALDVAPVAGRVLVPDDVRSGSRVALISHHVWQALFDADPAAVGQTITISWAGEYRGVAAESFTVVGVLPRGVRYPRGSDVWLPAWDGFGEARDNAMLSVIGRLGSDGSLAAARGEVAAVSDQLAIEKGEAYEGEAGQVNTFRDAIQLRASERASSTRFLLLAVAAFVLVQAVINAAAVFLVRAARHERDLVVRIALGARRSHLLTLMLTQSLLVSVAAGVCGVLLAGWGIELADARLSVSASGLAPVLDVRVLAAALGLSLISGLAVGAFPALRVGRSDLHGDLRVPGTRAAGGGRLQRLLVIGQVASALVLLTGAATLTRDFVGLVTRDLGFAPDRLVVARLPVGATHQDAVRATERVASLPGVESAALAGQPGSAPLYQLENGDSLRGVPLYRYRVNPDYFSTLGIPLLAGRTFTASDRAGSTPVAIVSETAARTWWSDHSPVGRTLLAHNPDGRVELVRIVGVTGDERISRDPEQGIIPILYRPWVQLSHERRRTEIFARTAGESGPLVPQARTLVRELRRGNGWQGDGATTMTAMLGDRLDVQRFRTAALTLFSIFGLLLAAMGIYGVVASVVSQRTAEIGVRLALGARPADVFALVIRGGMGLALVGLAVGGAGAFGVRRAVESIVVSTPGLDILPVIAAGVFLVAAVAAACYWPARRAVRIDPTTALRD